MAESGKRERAPSSAALTQRMAKQLKAEAHDAKAPGAYSQGEEAGRSAEPLKALLDQACWQAPWMMIAT